MYLEQKINTDKVIEEAKADYFKGQLEGADTKAIFATLNDLLSRNSRPLPESDDPKVLSEKFSKFFIDKIQKICSQLDSAEDETETVNDPDELQLYTTTTSQFCGFNEVSSEEISKLVVSRPNKTCSLDPIPNWLLKSCMPALLQPLTSIVNSLLPSDESLHTWNQAMDDCQQVEVQWWENRFLHCSSLARSRSPIWLKPSTWWWQEVFSILQRAQPRRSLWHQHANVRPGFSHMQNSQLPPIKQPVAYQKVH